MRRAYGTATLVRVTVSGRTDMPQIAVNHTPRTYRGVTLNRRYDPGYAMPWWAYVGDRFVSADTLSGLKQVVREHTK